MTTDVFNMPSDTVSVKLAKKYLLLVQNGFRDLKPRRYAPVALWRYAVNLNEAINQSIDRSIERSIV